MSRFRDLTSFLDYVQANFGLNATTVFFGLNWNGPFHKSKKKMFAVRLKNVNLVGLHIDSKDRNFILFTEIQVN